MYDSLLYAIEVFLLAVIFVRIYHYFKNTQEDDVEVEEVVELDIEYHKGTFYLYEMESRKFLGQGTTPDELKESLIRIFPDIEFEINEEALEQLKLA